MQFSHLTFCFLCVLSTIFRYKCLQVNRTTKTELECIAVRVCVVAEQSTAAICAENIFTSINVSDIAIHMFTNTCLHVGHHPVNIGWFMHQPVYRTIEQCGNQTQCIVEMDRGSSVLHIVAVLVVPQDTQDAVTPHMCLLRLTSHTGAIYEGHDRHLRCWSEQKVNNGTPSVNNTMSWVLPADVRLHLNKPIPSSAKSKIISGDREKREVYADDVLGSPVAFSPSRYDMKDFIFSDVGDSSDVFTGELTPDEQIWDADLPESLDPVMTFPDDFITRISTDDLGRKKKEHMDKHVQLTKSKLFPGKNIISPVKELPQFMSANNLLSMKTEKEVSTEIPTKPREDALKGRDMLMALEENIENKLNSSLNSLMQDKQIRDREEMSLVESLALENKVNDALAGVEKEPAFDKKGHLKPVVPPFNDNVFNMSRPLLNSDGNAVQPTSANMTLGEALPIPEHHISTIDKPKLPHTRFPPGQPILAFDQIETDANKTTTNSSQSLSVSSPQPFLSNKLAPDLTKSDFQILKEGAVVAESTFRASFDELKKDMRKTLRVHTHPGRRRLLESVEPAIHNWSHALAWAMVKQVCAEPLKRLKLTGTDAYWQEWTVWSPCTVTCGSQGYQVRRRLCQAEKECHGPNYDIKPCSNHPLCQGRTSWLEWSVWNPCSVTCGPGGVRFRMRSCLTEDIHTQQCQGPGVEFLSCSIESCQQKITPTPTPPSSNTFHDVHQNKTLNRTNITTTTSDPNTITTMLPKKTTQKHRKKRKKRLHWRRRTLQKRRHRRPHNRDVEDMQGQVLDSIVDDLQGMQDLTQLSKNPEMQNLRQLNEVPDMTPFHAMDRVKVLPARVTTPSPNIFAQTSPGIAWSVWGMWSECSVSCGKGTQFHRRQCIRRIADTLDGEPVKTRLCPGPSRDRKACVQMPCPLSVAIPKHLMKIDEKGDGRLSCQNTYRGSVWRLYWVTPSGQDITSSSEDGKYEMDNHTLIVHKAQKSDLGRYLCVLMGTNQIVLMSQANQSFVYPTPKGKGGVSVCEDNPCENGGTCEDVRDVWSHAHGQVFHYRCLCPVGFYGKHCQQKSLVHQYTPNLKMMGLVLLSLIAMLFITCTCLCAYYWFQRKQEVDVRPVMTRRRSEDQWRKMKRFDHKARSRTKSFSAKEIKKRLSRMWTGKEESDDKFNVKFGMESSPYSELASSLASPTTTGARSEFDEFNDKLASSDPDQSPDMENTAQKPSVDKSQNASPLTVDEAESDSESNVDTQKTRRRAHEVQDRPRQGADIQTNQSGDLMNHQRPQVTENRGDDADFKPGLYYQCDKYHFSTDKPAAIYSNHNVETYPDNNLMHIHSSSKHMEAEHNHPTFYNSEENFHNSNQQPSTTHLDNVYRYPIAQGSSSSTSSRRSKRKRHCRKGGRLHNSSSLELNQNNSDDSSDSTSWTDKVRCEGSSHSQDNMTRHHFRSSPVSERGHQSARHYSSTDSGEEHDTATHTSAHNGTGARPKVRTLSRLNVKESRTTVSNSGSRNDVNTENCQNTGFDMDSQRQPNDPYYQHYDSGRQAARQRIYEVYHPDEPYPFRQARTRRRSRDRSEQSGTSRTLTQGADQFRDETHLERSNNMMPHMECTNQSSDTTVPQLTNAASSHQTLRHLEGAGEGASASAHNTSRKSGREVLLRRAMENSFIQATSGSESWRAGSNTQRCPSPDPAECDISDLGTVVFSHMGHAVARPDSESSSRHHLFSASTFSCPSNLSETRPEEACMSDSWVRTADAPANQQPDVFLGCDLNGCTDSEPCISHAPLIQSGRVTSVPGLPTHHVNTQGNVISRQSFSDHCRNMSQPSRGFNSQGQAATRSNSSNSFCLRPHRSVNRTASPSKPNDITSLYEPSGALPNLCVHSTSQEKRTTNDQQKTNPDQVLFSVVESEHFRAGMSQMGNTGRETRPMRLDNDQCLLQDQTYETNMDQNKCVDSQAKPLITFDTCSSSDSVGNSKGKRTLKSALKHHSSLSTVVSGEKKGTSSTPTRRVSFSEPKRHTYNLDLPFANTSMGHRMNTRVSAARHSPQAFHEDTGQKPCTPSHNYYFPAADLDMFSTPAANQLSFQNEQQKKVTTAANSTKKTVYNTPTLSPVTNQTEPLWHSWFPSWNNTRQTAAMNQAEGFGGLKDSFIGEKDATSDLPFSLEATSFYQAKSKARECSHVNEGEDERGQPSVLQPALLVDLEPHIPADYNSQQQVLMPRGEQPVSLQLLRQSLMTPLTPSLASKKPTSEGESGENSASYVSAEACDSASKTQQDCVEHAETDSVIAAAPDRQGALSYNSFHEMLAMRSPGAFFKPINSKDNSHESND